MKPLSPDTTVQAQRRHYELMRRLTPAQRLALAFELTEAGRKLVLADLQHRFPQADETEIRRRFIARVLPREDVIRSWPNCAGIELGGKVLQTSGPAIPKDLGR